MLGRRVGITNGGWKWSCCCETIPALALSCSPIIPTHISIVITSSTLFKLQKTAAKVKGGTNWWKGDSGSDVQDVSGLAGCEDVVVRIYSFDILFN